MAEAKKNPLVLGLINLIPGVINTVGSLIKNKKNKDANSSQLLPAFAEDPNNIASGLELSSKAVVGYGLGGVIVMFALGTDLSQRNNLIVLCAGVFLVAVTTIAKAIERPDVK